MQSRAASLCVTAGAGGRIVQGTVQPISPRIARGAQQSRRFGARQRSHGICENVPRQPAHKREARKPNAGKGADSMRCKRHIDHQVLTLCAALAAALTTGALAQHYEYSKLLAPDGGAYDDFGYAVAVLGDVAIAGAYGDDGVGGTDSGSAYMFRREGALWQLEQKIEAADATMFAYFGYAVELHNDMALVGAISEEPGGAVYVFRRNPLNESWNQVQKIVPPDTAQGDSFGCSIDADGRYMAIGARMDSDVFNDAGSVYIYEYEDSLQQWVYLTEVRAHDPSANEWFGEELALSGDYVVVGLPRDDPNGLSSGSAYVFKRLGGAWIEQTKIIPADGAAESKFGSDVAIDGDTIAVGASDDWPAAVRCGAVYVYRGGNASWPLEQKVYDASAGAHHWDRFGGGVDVVGDSLLVGAWGSDANGTDRGAAYVYTRSGGTWTAQPALFFAFDGAALDEFGSAVDLDGARAIVGAFARRDNGQNTGAAYMFNDVHFTLSVTPDPPRAGAQATFAISNAAPFTRAALGYTIQGLRRQYVAPLQITIEIGNAVQIGAIKTTDANGRASWTTTIPSGAAGRLVWIQAIQFEKKTNVIARQVQP